MSNNVRYTDEYMDPEILDVECPKVFENVFHEYYASLCYFANKFVHDQEVAKDVVQDVFISLWESSNKFGNLIALKSFLYSCVQNRALNYLEKRNNREMANRKLGEPAYEEEKVFCMQVEADVFKEIFVIIEELPAECKRIFKMSYIEFLDIKTICKQLHIAETTVKTQRRRAKKFLRERLKHLYPVLAFLFF